MKISRNKVVYYREITVVFFWGFLFCVWVLKESCGFVFKEKDITIFGLGDGSWNRFVLDLFIDILLFGFLDSSYRSWRYGVRWYLRC